MKSIAITGANGFVGKSLIAYLGDQYNIYSITRDSFNLHDSDQTKAFFAKNKFDVVIHTATSKAAALHGDQNAELCENLRIYYNIEGCISSDTKLISFGSGAEYSKAVDLNKITEKSIGDFIPSEGYGFSKYVISRSIAASDKPIYSPIIFGLFGRFEDYRFKFISNSILKNILKLPIIINQNVLFDYLYIEDFVKIIKLYIDNDYTNRQFNITPTRSIDLVSIAEIINACSGYKSDIQIIKPGMNKQYTGSNAAMLSDIGEFEFTDYEQAIGELYSYYQQNIGNIDRAAIIADEYLKKQK